MKTFQFSFLLSFIVFTNYLLRYGGLYWNSLVNPTSIRLVNNGTLQYESFVVHRQILVFSQPSLPEGYLEYFGNTEYRAIFVSYFISLFLHFTRNIYDAVILVDFLFWTIGAISFFIFVREFTGSIYVAYISSILMTYSPLGIAWIGTSDGRTAQFMIFPLYILCIYRIIVRPSRYVSIYCGVVLFIISITYSYHYMIILAGAFYIFLSLNNSYQLVAKYIFAIITYLVIYSIFLYIINSLHLEIHYNLNDPANYTSQLMMTIYNLSDIKSAISFVSRIILLVFEIVIYSSKCYSSLVFVFSLIGLSFSSGILRKIAISSLISTTLLSMIYGPAWVVMSCYFVIYLLAGIGMCGSLRLISRFFYMNNTYSIIYSLVIITFSWLDINQDLWGSADFLRGWWGDAWVVPM